MLPPIVPMLRRIGVEIERIAWNRPG